MHAVRLNTHRHCLHFGCSKNALHNGVCLQWEMFTFPFGRYCCPSLVNSAPCALSNGGLLAFSWPFRHTHTQCLQWGLKIEWAIRVWNSKVSKKKLSPARFELSGRSQCAGTNRTAVYSGLRHWNWRRLKITVNLAELADRWHTDCMIQCVCIDSGVILTTL